MPRTCAKLTVPFQGCQDAATSQSLTAAIIKSLHEDALVTCKLAGICGSDARLPRPLQICSGDCSTPSDCDGGCYCNGMGQCADNCFTASCQGEKQWCPLGCVCGNIGFCNPS